MQDQSSKPILGVGLGADWHWRRPSAEPRQHSSKSGLGFGCCSSRSTQAAVQKQKPSLRASHLFFVVAVGKLGVAAVPYSVVPDCMVLLGDGSGQSGLTPPPDGMALLGDGSGQSDVIRQTSLP